jgi:uncharacterized protein
MKQKLSLITLGVTDLATSKEFYQDILGFIPEAASNENVAFYNLESCWLSLFQTDALAKDAGVSAEGYGFRQFTLAHNEPSIEAVDALFDELKAKGVTIVKDPETVFWGGYSGYFADTDGHLWEVAYNPFADLT